MNRIFLQFRDEGHTIIDAPIQEDFSIEASTEFTSFSDLCGPISNLVDLANTVSGTGGTISQTGLALRSIIDSQRWSKTNPIKINLDMFFYTKTNAKEDVVDKVNTLLWTHILWHDKNGRIHIPGINAKEIAEIDKVVKGKEGEAFEKTIETQGWQNKGESIKTATTSFFSVLIPGVVYLESAFMFAVKPTYSKQITEKGFPLWASVNVDIQGTAPAFVRNFEEGAKFFYSRSADNILKKKDISSLGGSLGL
jgi:hypothetical protein